MNQSLTLGVKGLKATTQGLTLGVKGLKVTTTLYESKFDSQSDRESVKSWNHIV